MRVAAIQMNSGADLTANLQLAEELIGNACDDGCKLIVLPENFAIMGKRGRDKLALAEQPGEGPIHDFLSVLSRRLDVWIVAGSMPLAAPKPEQQRVYGACPVYDPQGALRAVYRKIHLFDVELVEQQESYRESRSMLPGDEVMTVDTPAGVIGLSICYDVRFPELYRQLVDAGATIFTVPAAFTATTGEAHWHTLLRARAIENLAWVIAPGQYGMHPDGRRTYGHTLICDPWGRVLAEKTDGNGHVAADIDTELTKQLRSEFPALSNRRL